MAKAAKPKPASTTVAPSPSGDIRERPFMISIASCIELLRVLKFDFFAEANLYL
jgi:hypothetical protein